MAEPIRKQNLTTTRKGIKDIWNAFMVADTDMADRDLPLCPTTAARPPLEIVTWEEAKAECKRKVREDDGNYIRDAFVCWYLDDWKFDGPAGIWQSPWKALGVLSHYRGIITPDFSICQDFPEPIKLFNVYRMRAFGCWCASMGLEVINNVRWGTEETWGYCFSGIPTDSMVAIGTVASSLRRYEGMMLFERGLKQMMATCSPHTVIVYGSANYECLRRLEAEGIRVVQYDGATRKRFAKAAGNDGGDGDE